jgi:hypothetical protein
MLGLPELVARQEGLIRRRAALEVSLQEHHGTAARALESAADAASIYGLSEAIRGIDPKWAHHLFRYLGLPHRDKRPLQVRPEIRAAATTALLDPTVHAVFREAVNAGKKRRKVEVELEELDHEVKRIDTRLDHRSLPKSLNTVEDEINAICARYEKKFRRAGRYMTLRRLALLLTGAAKAAENITTSIGSTVDTVAKGFSSTSD